MSDTFTDRREQEYVVKRLSTTRYEDGEPYLQIDTTDSTGFVQPLHPGMESIVIGDHIILETTHGSTITGLKPPGGDWWFRKTDAELEADHVRLVEKFRRQREERWEQNRAEWALREMALPDDLRVRLEFFRERGGHEFDVEGWGYELIICELADLYRKAGKDDEGYLFDTPEISEYAAFHGTTGNQHDVAKLLAHVLLDGASENLTTKDVPSALTPLGSTRDYGPREE